MKIIRISDANYKVLDRIGDPDSVVRILIKTYAGELIQPAQVAMDLQPADRGAYHSQKQWIELYNSQEGEFEGRRMISAPDVIRASKSASPKALASLQKDCIDSWVVTSTHISYEQGSLAGIVTHNYNTRVVRPKAISLDEIPIYQGEPVSKVVETTEGLSYLRALADDRHAKPAELLERLERLVALSQREPKDIVLWTPDKDSRKAYTERAVGFFDDGRGFHVDGSDFDDIDRRSRGVLINPRSGRAKK